MSLLDALRHRLHVRLRPGAYLREIDEEMAFHLALESMQQEHGARGGISPTDARSAARRRFGNLTTTRARTRHMAGLGLFDAAREDVRFALRTLRRAPGFTAVAVLTLAIGIGANTAIFSAVNALLLRPLPFHEPARLMKVSLTFPPEGDQPGNDDVIWSYPKFVVFRDAQTVFSTLGLFAEDQYTLPGPTGAERLRGERADAGYLATLGVRPALGRNFAAEEDRAPNGPRVVMLGDALWKRRYNADPAVLGRAITVGAEPHVVVGVLPPGFRGLSGEAELWLPMMAQPAEQLNENWMHSYTLVGRLASGATPERAKAAVARLGPRIYDAYPNPQNPAAPAWGAAARELDATRVDPLVRRSLLVLLGAAGLLLLIACANVANLCLVRATGRRREIAVRLAVGAPRGRLVRQLLTESLVLAALGGAASVAVAWWGVRLLAALNPAEAFRAQQLGGIGAVTFSSIQLDVPAFAFAALLALGTGVVFGLAPALQATHPSLTGGLKEGNAPAPARGGRGLASRNVLATAELALAVVLLAGSGLMLRSLGNLLDVRPGFDGTAVLTLRLTPPEGLAPERLAALQARLVERLAALPGATGAGLADCPPLNGGCNGTVLVRRDRARPPAGSEPRVGVHWATPGWFATLGVPLRRGRLFVPADRAGARKAVLVSETAARRFWPDEDPVGRPVSVGQGGFWDDTAYVVGVVGDVRFGTLDSLPAPDVYLPYAQSPLAPTMAFVRTSGDPLALAAAARRAVAELTPDAPVFDVRTMEARAGDATAAARFRTVLLTLFGVVALALATVGTYGVIAFATAQRTQEIGVRMVLGATRAEVARLVVGQGVRIALVGGALGLVGALALTRAVRSLLYGVTPSDPATFAAIAALLALSALAANWLPARRAARIDPATALRG